MVWFPTADNIIYANKRAVRNDKRVPIRLMEQLRVQKHLGSRIRHWDVPGNRNKGQKLHSSSRNGRRCHERTNEE